MQQTPGKHNPLTYYIRTLVYAFIALFLRVVALAPLAALFAFPETPALRFLALLCPTLFVFVVLPFRFSFAQALVAGARARFFSFDTALNGGDYWEKVREAMIHFVSVAKWGVPLLLLCGYAYYLKGGVDAKTVMLSLMGLGQSATAVWSTVSGFFLTLFGGAAAEPLNGSLMQGIYVVLGVVMLAVLVLVYGAFRNSPNRYLWVLANENDRSARTEIRRRMRGRRWKQMLVGLCNLALWAPFLIVVFLSLKSVVGDTATQLMMAIGFNSTATALDVSAALWPMIAAFLFLYMPLLPLRRRMTASFATRPLSAAAEPAHEA